MSATRCCSRCGVERPLTAAWWRAQHDRRRPNQQWSSACKACLSLAGRIDYQTRTARTLIRPVDDVLRELLTRALRLCSGEEAARRLGIGHATLWRWVRRWRIDARALRAEGRAAVAALVRESEQRRKQRHGRQAARRAAVLDANLAALMRAIRDVGGTGSGKTRLGDRIAASFGL